MLGTRVLVRVSNGADLVKRVFRYNPRLNVERETLKNRLLLVVGLLTNGSRFQLAGKDTGGRDKSRWTSETRQSTNPGGILSRGKGSLAKSPPVRDGTVFNAATVSLMDTSLDVRTYHALLNCGMKRGATRTWSHRKLDA